jgi:glycosyltransferase involved in cell wall biosynthesis
MVLAQELMTDLPAAPGSGPQVDRARIAREIRAARRKEWILFDSPLAQIATAATQWTRAQLQCWRGLRLPAWQTLMHLHRSALSRWYDRRIESKLKTAIASGELQQLLNQYVQQTELTGRLASIAEDPAKLLGPHATVLKSARPGERGVLLLNYSYTYAPFAKLFDLHKVCSRYFLVLEPSWSGTCDESILIYGFLPAPVFVQSSEPRDQEFLRRLPAQLVPVRTAANWWVDHNLYRPLPEVQKDRDLVMVASWAGFKRHERFFQTLAEMKQAGNRLTAVLVGYPSGMTRQQIEERSAYYQVQDQLEFYEWLPPEEVNRQMNRARLNIVWSRREGSNRAVIEGLFAGLPFILRRGFNFGHHHEHVNPQTGEYADDQDLPQVMLRMLGSLDQYRPREWAMNHMTHLHATAILEDAIRTKSAELGEPWTAGLVSHMSVLNGNQYLEESVAEQFQADYDYLRGCVKR